MFRLHAWMCTVRMPGAQSPERLLDLLELEFQAIVSCLMWMLGTIMLAFECTASALSLLLSRLSGSI